MSSSAVQFFPCSLVTVWITECCKYSHAYFCRMWKKRGLPL